MDTQHKTDSCIEEEDNAVGPDALDFMEANGKEFFIVNENPDIDSDSPKVLNDKNSRSKAAADADSTKDIHDLDKAFYTEENRANNRCYTPYCGGTTSGADKFCYYCNKKHKGLTKNEYKDLTFSE